MNNDAIYQRLTALITKCNSFSICLPANPTVDSVAAACSLYLAITKLGKQVTLACFSDISQNYGIAGQDKIQKTIATGGDNLVVSFPYSEGSIDKVTYNIEGNTFNLVIAPREGYEKLASSQVKYTYSGGKVDAIIVVDAATLASLGELYTANQEQFKGKDVINVDRHLTNANFGTVNIVEKKLSSTSEIVLRVLSYLNVQIDKDLATSLYAGIAAATNNFTSYSTTAVTFEASAYLLKAGAVKKAQPRPAAPAPMQGMRQPLGVPQGFNPGPDAPYQQQPYGGFNQQPMSQQPLAQPMGAQPQPYPAFDEFEDEFDVEPTAYPPIQPQQQPMNQQPPMSQQPMAPKQQQSQRPQQSQQQQQGQETPVTEKQATPDKTVENKEAKPDEKSNESDEASAPKEWLKPKIFRGSNLI